jgi:hypothetical protein
LHFFDALRLCGADQPGSGQRRDPLPFPRVVAVVWWARPLLRVCRVPVGVDPSGFLGRLRRTKVFWASTPWAKEEHGGVHAGIAGHGEERRRDEQRRDPGPYQHSLPRTGH